MVNDIRRKNIVSSLTIVDIAVQIIAFLLPFPIDIGKVHSKSN